VPALAPALVRLAHGVDIMPPLRAVAISRGGQRVVLGMLTAPQREKLVAELRARIQVPIGAPAAGLGGASSGDGVSGLAGIALWRRRPS
jgi:hypothetical protein